MHAKDKRSASFAINYAEIIHLLDTEEFDRMMNKKIFWQSESFQRLILTSSQYL
jgi:hypothetical protein